MKVATRFLAIFAVSSLAIGSQSWAEPSQGDSLPSPLFPRDNWWNTDISWAPVDWRSGDYLNFLNRFGTLSLHPDLGGNDWDDPQLNYGFPYAVVDGWQPGVGVNFQYWADSDQLDGWPIPDQAIWQAHWVQSGPPGYVDIRWQDRHLIIVDRDRNYLYELYNVWFDRDSWQWYAGSGASWNMNTNNRRPEGLGSATESGLAILPGLVRYDEVYGPNEIEHALGVSVPSADGYVYPASCGLERVSGSVPLGTRFRLREDKDISGYPWEVQKIFRAMKKYGLIATTKSWGDLLVSGTYDTRWNNGIFNPAFHNLTAWDFEIVQLGWTP